MQQLEKGTRSPSPEIVLALCDLLDVRPEFFARPVPASILRADVNFRKLKTSKVSFQNQLVATANLLQEVISIIGEKVDFPDVSFPSFGHMDSPNMDALTEKFRDHMELGTDSPIESITRILENLGAVCVKSSDIPEKISAISVNGERPLVIHDGDGHQPTRQRFDLAHELGHLVLHRGVITGDDKTEAEANAFASALLMPRRAFMSEWPLPYRVRVDQRALRALSPLKELWGASYAAIFRRARDLGLIGDATYTGANIFLRKKGYGKKEPQEPLHGETPELIASSFEVLQDALQIRVGDIAFEMGLRTSQLESLLGVQGPREAVDSENVVDLGAYAADRKKVIPG